MGKVKRAESRAQNQAMEIYSYIYQQKVDLTLILNTSRKKTFSLKACAFDTISLLIHIFLFIQIYLRCCVSWLFSHVHHYNPTPTHYQDDLSPSPLPNSFPLLDLENLVKIPVMSVGHWRKIMTWEFLFSLNPNWPL